MRVGYIGIDDGDNSDDASVRSSRHSQLVPFTVPTSDLETLLPLFSSSSRSEANRRCVRSALGCKYSISVIQDDRIYTKAERIFFFFSSAKRREGEKNGGML
jgi:hypothetical protein